MIDLGGMVVPFLPPESLFFDAVLSDVIETPDLITDQGPFIPRPPKPPPPRPPKRGGPAGGGGGGGWRDPDCGPDQIYDPVKDECVDIFGRPKETVFEELGALPQPGTSGARSRSMYQIARLLGPGWAGYAATKVAGKLATDVTGSKHAGTVANLGTFAAAMRVTKWRRLEGYRGRVILGSAMGALDDVVKRYIADDPRLTHQPLASAERLISTARAVGKPIEASAIPHRAKDGKSVVILRYTVTVGSTVMYWQEARPVETGGEINLAGTLLAQLRRVP